MDGKETYDYPLIGFNIRCSRMARNKTQAEIAEAASVDRSTVRRIEAGRRVNIRSIEKICAALGRPVALINSLMPYGTPGQDRITHVHRREEISWFAIGDTRKTVAKNNQALLQTQSERLRIARLGKADMFEAYMVTLPYGPSVSRAEICGVVSLSPHETYHSCLIVCLRGELVFRVGEDAFTIREGDSFGFDTQHPATLEPASAIGKTDFPPEVFFVMGNRKGHVPVEFKQTKRRRIRRQLRQPPSSLVL
jgi:transcriptional regulator with XRE-family HTH domain